MHPDKNQGDEEANGRFQDLGSAYEVSSKLTNRFVNDGFLYENKE